MADKHLGSSKEPPFSTKSLSLDSTMDAKRRRKLLKYIQILFFLALGLSSLVYQWPHRALLEFIQPSKPLPALCDVYPDTDYPLRQRQEPWNISTSYPYPRKLEREVSEGTWLRISTHPTRREIVFDMLGDLYCMNLDGAEDAFGTRRAMAILQGVPYDKEPEFSKDGTSVVFISDAGLGVDNIWTLPYSTCFEMSLISESIRASTIQQTNSTFRFFSSPSFNPTKQTIIATKWFLTGPPAIASELWEIPIKMTQTALSGTEGQRIVGRKLPASWSPHQYEKSQLGAEQGRCCGKNGDGVIYSRNIRDDLVGYFSWNKDVHQGISAIFLYNTTTRATEQVVDATPGGANVPRLSHDGKSLAFIRRVGPKSALVLKDLTSGTLHYAWHELTYDVSTIPAPMGAYPNYGFSANDTSIIIWSSGHIYEIPLRLNYLGERVADGPPSMVPFKAKINLALGNTRYSERDIRKVELQDTGILNSFRALRTNWDGTKAVFEGAGSSYVLDVSSGNVSLLPSLRTSDKHYDPTFGRDPTHVVVSAWSAINLTTFELIDTATGMVGAIQGVPRGRYLSPVVGCGKIAFVRTGADRHFGDIEETTGAGTWLGKIGLADFEVPQVVVTDLKRIDTLASEDIKLDFKFPVADGICTDPRKSVIILQSSKFIKQFDFDGKMTHLLATGKSTTQMVPSHQVSIASHPWAGALSDFIWPKSSKLMIAFRDFHHIWLAQSARSSLRNIWSKPGHKDTPDGLIRLSQYGGHDVTFSGDGKIVFWLSGKRLLNFQFHITLDC